MKSSAEALRVTAAAFFSGTGNFTVTFNRALRPGALDPGNWHFYVSGVIYRAATAVASGVTVSGTTAYHNFTLEPDHAEYSPPPYDVRAIAGNNYGPNDSIPLTVIP